MNAMTCTDSPQKLAKMAAGKKACEFIVSGMTVGLGSGSTVACFIESLGDACREGLNIKAVAASEQSKCLAEAQGISLVNINSVRVLDIAIDGADEIDHTKRMIKGGGGALLREKLIASNCWEMVVIVDPSKVVEALGSFPLAVEIVPFAYERIIDKMESKGYHGALRLTKESHLYLTENGNYIYDVQLDYPCMLPEEDHEKLRSIPGVVETGFFFNLARRVIVGHEDGRTEVW
jgi:ribose 5-phosphate isomerase A